jgi:hypothetical protein
MACFKAVSIFMLIEIQSAASKASEIGLLHVDVKKEVSTTHKDSAQWNNRPEAAVISRCNQTGAEDSRLG